jgi:hypothetical protein
MIPQPASRSAIAAEHALVVAAWQEHQLPIEVIAPTPATVDELALAHDRAYVEGVLAGRIPNGLGDCSPEVVASLPYATGALLSAAQHAIEHHTIACAPCSGSHHARYAGAAARCTFNNLAVTACALRARGIARCVGILDCAMQAGDGLEEILDRVGAHAWVVHFKAGVRYSKPSDAAALLDDVRAAVQSMRGCDVVLYQAGPGARIGDRLGGWLTSEQLRRRDGLVFESLRALGVPVAWCFAGDDEEGASGSLPGVFESYTNTAREALRAVELDGSPDPSPAAARARFDAAFTQHMYRDLVRYARGNCCKRGRAAYAISAEDVVHTAIEKTLDGTRTWDPARVDLAQHLRGVIASELGHAVWRIHAFPEVPVDVVRDAGPVAAELARIAATERLARQADEEARAIALDRLRQAACGDVGVRTLLAAYETGARNRREVIASTGMTPHQYEAALWRLMKLVRKHAEGLREAA